MTRITLCAALLCCLPAMAQQETAPPESDPSTPALPPAAADNDSKTKVPPASEPPASEPPASEPPVAEEPSVESSAPPPAANLAPPSDLPLPEGPTPVVETESESQPVAEVVAEEKPGKRKLLVMNLKPNGIDQALVAPINAAIQQQAIKSFVGEVVTSEQLRVLLDTNALQQLVGCDSENCMADFGSRVDAEVVLGGNVTAVGDDLLITVLALEPGTGRTIGSEQRKVPQVNDLVFYAARQLTSLVLTGRTVDPTVPVRVTTNAPDGELFVDGRSLGPAPITVKLDPGSHELKITADDFTPWKLTISVEEGTPLQIDAMMEEKGGFPLWPIALVFATGGAVFGGVAAVSGLHSLERLNGSPPLLGLSCGLDGAPCLFDPLRGPYNAPGKNTADLSRDSSLILLLGIATDVFLGLAAFSVVIAVALLLTDVVIWSFEE